jgi:hypothetical protein
MLLALLIPVFGRLDGLLPPLTLLVEVLLKFLCNTGGSSPPAFAGGSLCVPGIPKVPGDPALSGGVLS